MRKDEQPNPQLKIFNISDNVRASFIEYPEDRPHVNQADIFRFKIIFEKHET